MRPYEVPAVRRETQPDHVVDGEGPHTTHSAYVHARCTCALASGTTIGTAYATAKPTARTSSGVWLRRSQSSWREGCFMPSIVKNA